MIEYERRNRKLLETIGRLRKENEAVSVFGPGNKDKLADTEILVQQLLSQSDHPETAHK